jgi:flagellar biosynthesis/type III secretory pathway protein FliH
VSDLDVRPFLSFQARPTRAFADAITSVEVLVQPSPWSPKSDSPATAQSPSIDVEALRADAVARGREEGLAETAALRARLRSLVEQTAAFHASRIEKLGTQVADATCAVVGAWSPSDRRAVFTSIISAWTARSLGAASARVNPQDAELLADSGLAVEADPSIKPGDIIIRNAQAELAHVWDDRLRELHDTIVTALEAAP